MAVVRLVHLAAISIDPLCDGRAICHDVPMKPIPAALALLGALVPFGSAAPSAQELPYVAVHNPEFISPKAATFMNAEDRVIGLMSGKAAKAYPPGILAQHGLVEDDSPTGPIAITW